MAHVSHDLRTPLNAIIGFSDVLLQGSYGPLDEKQGRYMQNIYQSGKHLLELINDILDLARLEAREAGVEPGGHGPGPGHRGRLLPLRGGSPQAGYPPELKHRFVDPDRKGRREEAQAGPLQPDIQRH